jgi:hypothetical protein
MFDSNLVQNVFFYQTGGSIINKGLWFSPFGKRQL